MTCHDLHEVLATKLDVRLSVGRWLFGCDQLAAAWPKGARSFLLMAGWHWLGQCLKYVKFDISKAKQCDQCAADDMIKKIGRAEPLPPTSEGKINLFLDPNGVGEKQELTRGAIFGEKHFRCHRL